MRSIHRFAMKPVNYKEAAGGRQEVKAGMMGVAG
jgi:hypothetical protein